MGVLTVVLRKIDHLRDEDTLGKSDPYVKLHLEQDNWILDKNLGRHSSSKKKNDCSPVYNETFTFDDVNTLNNLRLHIRVVDDDFGRDDYLGECTINLERLHLSNTPTKIEEVIDSKNGGGWFSRKATVSVEVSYAK